MEPEAHRLDREAMIADHLAVAARIRREVDEAHAAAAAKRRAYQDWFVGRMRTDARVQLDRDRIVAGMLASFASRNASGWVAASPGIDDSEWRDEIDADELPFVWAVGEG